MRGIRASDKATQDAREAAGLPRRPKTKNHRLLAAKAAGVALKKLRDVRK
jgi:hypothetical protein